MLAVVEGPVVDSVPPDGPVDAEVSPAVIVEPPDVPGPPDGFVDAESVLPSPSVSVDSESATSLGEKHPPSASASTGSARRAKSKGAAKGESQGGFVAIPSLTAPWVPSVDSNDHGDLGFASPRPSQ